MKRHHLSPIALAGIVAGATGLLTVGTVRVKEWVVMTDELLYAKLAAHVAGSGSPLPVLHGEHAGFLGMVYPILLAPFYGTLGPVGGYTAAHIVNAAVFASASVPAFLLARRLVPDAWSLAVALLSVAVPWAVISGFVMSEAAAYPAFLWAFLGCQRALSEPSPRSDALAVGALALAFFTRPQFLFLAAALPLAAVIVDGPRLALGRHRLLAGVYALGIAAVVPLAALGQAHRLLGDYGVTATQGSLLPAAVWKSAALHLDVLAVGIGVLPFLLGAAWAYSKLRDASAQVRAFSALTAVALPMLAIEAASYDVRFGGSSVIRDRYVCYLAPVLLVAAAASLRQRPPLLALAGATAFFAATVTLAEFRPVAGLWVDSPVAVLNGVIHDESSGLSAGAFVAVCGILIGAICAGLRLVPRTAAAVGAALAVFAFSGSVTGYAFERLLGSRTPSGTLVTGASRVRDWVDRTADGPVGLLAYPVSRDWGQSALVWWDVEFWNGSTTRAFVTDETFTYTPFPSTELRLDFKDGTFAGTADAPPNVLGAPSDPRFELAGTQAAANVGLTLRVVERPYRARWATRGLDVDGFTRPDRPVTIRVYGEPGTTPQRVRVAVTLDSPPEAKAPVRYRLDGRPGSVTPASRVTAETELCVPPAGHADAVLEADRAATIAGPPLGPAPGPLRDVGPVVSGVQLTSTGAPCRP